MAFYGGLSCRVQLDPSSTKIDKQGIRPLRPWTGEESQWVKVTHSLKQHERTVRTVGYSPWSLKLLDDVACIIFSCPLDGTIISQILKPNNQDTLKDMPFVPRRKGVSLFVLDVIGRCKRRSSHPPNRWNIYWPQLSQKKNVFCLYLTVCLSSRHIWRNIIASQ